MFTYLLLQNRSPSKLMHIIILVLEHLQDTEEETDGGSSIQNSAQIVNAAIRMSFKLMLFVSVSSFAASCLISSSLLGLVSNLHHHPSVAKRFLLILVILVAHSHDEWYGIMKEPPGLFDLVVKLADVINNGMAGSQGSGIDEKIDVALSIHVGVMPPQDPLNQSSSYAAIFDGRERTTRSYPSSRIVDLSHSTGTPPPLVGNQNGSSLGWRGPLPPSSATRWGSSGVPKCWQQLHPLPSLP